MQLTPSLLAKLARKYVWWKSPQEAAAMPERVVAQTMNMGSFDDVQELAQEAGDDYLRGVVGHTEIGQFNERSWSYWHYRLRLATPGRVPPLPKRRLG